MTSRDFKEMIGAVDCQYDMTDMMYVFKVPAEDIKRMTCVDTRVHGNWDPNTWKTAFANNDEVHTWPKANQNFKLTPIPGVPDINKVIFNGPATIVFWSDNTKTIVRNQGDDWEDPEKGLAMAIAKKALGNKGSYYEVFKKRLK